MKRNHIGKTIRQLREELHFPLWRVARESKLSKGLLSRMENGLLTNPTLSTLNALAACFGLSTAWRLLQYHEEHSK